MSGAMKILVVDDDASLLAASSRILKGAGYDVYEASDGAGAVETAGKVRPDLILLDVVLPDISGIEVCRIIKADPAHRDLFVIFFSSSLTTSDHQSEGLESGADGYIARPIGNRELLARVEALVRIKKVETELRLSRAMMAGILDSSLNGIMAFKAIRGEDHTITDFEYLLANRAVKDILGHSPEYLQGRRLLEVYPGHRESGLFEKYAGVVEIREPIDMEYRYNFDDKDSWYRIMAVPFEDGFVVTFSDITAMKRNEEKLSDLATTDTMTGLFNRRTGLAILSNKMELARRDNTSLTVCFIDVNNLKMVNDTFGHKEGDDLIKTAARIVKESLRESDVMCRMGGDEFLFILSQCTSDCSIPVWERVQAKIAETNKDGERPYEISLSHGFAEYSPAAGLTLDELVEAADGAMYAEKTALKNMKKQIMETKK